MHARSSLLTLALVAVAAALPAQGGAPARASAPADAGGATVSGVVRDSLSRLPLRGAWVQLASRDPAQPFTRTVRADSGGRYTMDGVPPGRFALGFFHPVLDSLGVEPAAREVRVVGRRSVRADLSTPSPAYLRAVICGPGPLEEFGQGALLLGVVRSPTDGAPVAGATVVGEWVELTMRQGGALERAQPRLTAVTGENGAYALCNVPLQGSVYLTAVGAGDTTHLVEVRATNAAVLRRDLYVGRATGRLRGVVRTAGDAQPLAGALVRVSGGRTVRTNDRGEFLLPDAPAGSRLLEVRAIGYFPHRRPVDVVPGAAPLVVDLSTFQAMLDTVRITVSRVTDRSNGGFAARQRSTAGRFITAEQIARRPVIVTSQIFMNQAGIQFEGAGLDEYITIRDMMGGRCQPHIFVDGAYMWTLSNSELDAVVQPSRIAGIEYYSRATVPAQFQMGLDTCGAVVIWTK